MSDPSLSRGDVVIVRLDPTEGAEQRGTHPCLVVQNDVGNEDSPTTIVVPFTTAGDGRTYPFEVHVGPDSSPLPEASVRNCSQTQTISIEHRVQSVLGPVDAESMDAVDEALRYSLGLIPV